MQAQATAKFVRMAPRKVRFVLDTIRGKYCDDALAQLKFTPNFAADEIANVLRSAMANAEHNHGMSTESMKVARCYVDVGPTLKRVQPRAQGRAYRILKRMSHITVIVEEAEPKPTTRPREMELKKRKKPPLRAALPTPEPLPEPVVEEVPTPAATVEERDETEAAPATETVETDATEPKAE